MNKGFTLVEIIGVVIVLGLITLVSFPLILKTINDSRGQISDATTNLIVSSAMQYTDKYSNDLPKTQGNVYCVTVERLINEDLLPSTIENEYLGSYGLQTKVKITINNDKYNYTIDNNCIEVK